MKTGGILLLRLEEANCVKLDVFYESEKKEIFEVLH